MITLRPEIQFYNNINDRPAANTFGAGICMVNGNLFTSDGVTWSGGGESVYTWAAKPTAPEFVGTAFISDIGVNGSLWYSNGVKWMHEGPIQLLNDTTGWLLPSLLTGNAATYSQSGTTITVASTAHGIPATVYNGRKVYLNPGVATTGATIPAGWFTNFQYVDANSFTCTSTASQTGTGTAVVTTTTEIAIPAVTATVAAGLLGLNGYIDAEALLSCENSAATKTLTIALGSFDFYAHTVTTNASHQSINRIQNMGDAAKQAVVPAGKDGFTGAGGAILRGTVDTSAATTVSTSLALSAASTFATLESITVTIWAS
jgi:hypothetical protein